MWDCVGLCGIPVVSRTVVVSSCPLINANEFISHTCTLWVPIFSLSVFSKGNRENFLPRS